MRKQIATAAAAAVVLALAGAPALATADDLLDPPPADVVSTDVQPAPDPADPADPADPPAGDPITDQAPDLAAPALAAEPQVQAQSRPAPNPTITATFTFETGLADGVTDPKGAGDVTWPQPYVGPGALTPPCGVWYQVDVWKGKQTAFDAILADNLLELVDGVPEDSKVIHSWQFVYGGDCAEPAPEPQVCTSSGVWGTEADDVAPIATIDGLRFDGGSGSAVGIGTALLGNLQGLTPITYTATGSLELFYPRIVIDSTADGGYAYDSLTVISEGPVTGDSIAASNKRGFEQHTLTEWAALLPHNQLVALFLHLDSAAPADASVVLQNVASSCLELVTGIPQPEPLTGTDPTVGDPVCVEGEDGVATVETWTTDWTQAYVPNADRTGWILDAKVYAEPRLVKTETIESADCTIPPVDEEPPTEEEPPATPTPIPADELAYTGQGDGLALGIAFGVVALAAGVFAIVSYRIRSKQE